MAGIQYNFYECINPDCELRFPGYESGPRWNRCPRCRANTRLVAKVGTLSRQQSNIKVNKSGKLIALLDNIRSAWNVGSIFRTADGFGIGKIFLCGISPTPENHKLAKTALGAELSVPWEYFTNGVKLTKDLKSQGYALCALEDYPGATPLFQVDVSPIIVPLVLIAGNEVCGIDPEIIAHCDQVISIPMYGKKQSYNVAIAFGIALSFLSYRLNEITPDRSGHS